MKLKIFLATLFISTLTYSSALADETAPQSQSPAEIAEQLQQRYDKMTSLVFDFYQHTKGSVTGRPKVGKGSAMFLKLENKALMRWDYAEPAKQVLTSDGVTFSMYFEEMNQQIITPAENLESDITYSFFTGKGKLVEDFEILPPDAHAKEAVMETEQPQIIKMIPKKAQSQLQDIHVWVTPDYLIGRLQIRDHFDTITTLSFGNMEVDTLNSASSSTDQFNFTPPEGTEIISQ